MSSDLWSFSLDTYARPGVEAACLTLQSSGMNVCLLLCGLWLAERGVVCNEQRLQKLRNVVDPWDAEVVRPLRSLRVQWKTGSTADAELHDLRVQVKTLEMEAERHLLLRLERLAQPWPQGEASDGSTWLEGMAAGAANPDHDALLQLRAAVSGL